MKSTALYSSLVAFLGGCNAHSFDGGAAKRSPQTVVSKSIGGEGSPSNPAGVPGSGGNNPAGSGAGGPVAQSGINESCLAKKARDYHIAVVIDSSLSQRITDPQNLRGEAVVKFAKNLETFAKKSAGRSVQLAIIGFAAAARTGGNSPVDLARDSADKVTQDVIGTSRIGGIGTNYEAGLTEADKALRAMGAQKGQLTQRNFVIFLSDGEPNRGSAGRGGNSAPLISGIQTQVGNLVSTLDVALITIASGTDIDARGIDIIQQMAQPSGQGTIPDHLGHYIRVDSGDDLEGLSQELGKAISGC